MGPGKKIKWDYSKLIVVNLHNCSITQNKKIGNEDEKHQHQQSQV